MKVKLYESGYIKITLGRSTGSKKVTKIELKAFIKSLTKQYEKIFNQNRRNETN